MANTRKVLLSLHTEVADRLGQETNKSAVVDALVAAHYGLSFENGSTASSKRQSILDSINAAKTEVQPTTEPVVNPTETPVEVAPQEGAAQPEVQTPFVPVVTPVVVPDTPVGTASDFVPVVQPLDPVEPAITSEVQADEPQVAESTDSSPFVPVVTPLDEVVVTPEETTEASGEPVAADEPFFNGETEPAFTDEVPTEESPVESEATEPAPVPAGVKTCPNCGEAMVTAICLNCL